jgi:hypothetical protein
LAREAVDDLQPLAEGAKQVGIAGGVSHRGTSKAVSAKAYRMQKCLSAASWR